MENKQLPAPSVEAPEAIKTFNPARSTLAITLLVLINTAFSYFSHVIIASRFGVSGETDAYFVATDRSWFLLSFFSTIVVIVIIPIFIETEVEHGSGASWKFASSAGSLLLICLGMIVLITEIFRVQIIRFTAPGLPVEVFGLAVSLMLWLGLMVILMGFNHILISVHQAGNHFILSTTSNLLPPLGLAIGVLLFHQRFGIFSAVFGQIVGAVIQICVLSFGIVGRNRLMPTLSWAGSGMLAFRKMMIPLLMGGPFYLLLPVIESGFASTLAPGIISYLSIGSRVSNFVGPILVTGLATTLFPVLSKHGARKNWADARETLSLTLRIFLLLAVPVIVFSPFYARPLVTIFLEYGRFSPEDTAAVVKLVPFYTLAMMAASFGSLIARGHFSLYKDTRTFSINTAIFLAVYVVFIALALPRLGYLALPLASVVYWSSSVASLTVILRRKLGGLNGRFTGMVFLRSLASALIVAFLILIIWQSVSNLVLQLLVIGFAFIVYFFLALSVFHVREFSFFWKNIVGSAPSESQG